VAKVSSLAEAVFAQGPRLIAMIFQLLKQSRRGFGRLVNLADFIFQRRLSA